MLFTTTTQFAALAVALIAGWLFGLASAPGGRRWKDRYTTERDAHAVTRRELEARAATAEARVRELERDHARLAPAAAPVAGGTVAAPTIGERVRAAISPAPVATARARPAYPRRGWFDWQDRTRLR